MIGEKYDIQTTLNRTDQIDCSDTNDQMLMFYSMKKRNTKETLIDVVREIDIIRFKKMRKIAQLEYKMNKERKNNE